MGEWRMITSPGGSGPPGGVELKLTPGGRGDWFRCPTASWVHGAAVPAKRKTQGALLGHTTELNCTRPLPSATLLT